MLRFLYLSVTTENVNVTSKALVGAGATMDLRYVQGLFQRTRVDKANIWSQNLGKFETLYCQKVLLTV